MHNREAEGFPLTRCAHIFCFVRCDNQECDQCARDLDTAIVESRQLRENA